MEKAVTEHSAERIKLVERFIHRFVYQERDRLKRQRWSITAEIERTIDKQKLAELNAALTKNSEERAELEANWKASTVRANEKNRKADSTKNTATIENAVLIKTEQEMIC